ncbi:unnamed protein product [Albugo candida]|uniref:Uncharacterized protein n=1 Tax=Albugo candida TaxID=65357 RepID=A0A024FYH8_9STRA|nr:unnamed protein product [Albugo candida]|eukprot:CCI39644.1 unnamed protein product [Albugo candida]
MIREQSESESSVTQNQLPELYGHSRKVYALEYNADGSMLASGSSDKTVRVWTNLSEKGVIEFRGHTDPILSLAWDPTSLYRVSSTSSDKTVRVWDVKAGKIAQTVTLQNEAMNIVYSHDGKYIAVSNLDCVTLIETKKYRVVQRVVNPYEVNEIQFSRTGHFYVAAGHPTGHGMFEIMRVSCDGKGKPFLENLHKVTAHAGSCFCLDFHPSGKVVALGSVDSLVSLWDLQELYCVRTFTVTSSSIRTVRFNHDGSYLAIGTEDSNIIVVLTETSEIACSVQLQNLLQYLCWHPKQNIFSYVGDKASDEKNANRDGVIKSIKIASQENTIP